jgi:hypothetical protein
LSSRLIQKTIKNRIAFKFSTYTPLGLSNIISVPLGQDFSPFEGIKPSPVLFEIHTSSAIFLKNVGEIADTLV